MKLSDFDYKIPEELIAQYPAKCRDECRLMVLDRRTGMVCHKEFREIAGYFREGDCLILNNTRVMPSRLFGRRSTGGKVEIFILENKDPVTEALVRPAARLKDGETIMLESGDKAELVGRGKVGRLFRFSRPVSDVMRSAGHMPLPPYIGRQDQPSDRDDYQTVYGVSEGATASPTAGLHFTREILSGLSEKGVIVKYITLHTNYGTFAPVKTEDVEGHKMHHEFFSIPSDTVEAVRKSKNCGGKIFAVGTTSTRSLEYWAKTGAVEGDNDLFIYPGFEFKVVDHLITNFHLPKSTLLLLASAFAGREPILDAYRQAIRSGYRFFSYGDAMLII